MGDAPWEESTVFDFDELADHLVEQGLESSPADIHGCLCGLLAAGAAVQPELSLAALNETMELELHGELAAQVMRLYEVSAAALADEEFDFHLLLPDDEADIDIRVAAMAGWCRGFLAGYALVAAGAGTASDNAVTDDTREVLSDIAAIAQAEPDEDDDPEAAEESFFELAEYIRFAVLNVFLEHQHEGGEDAPVLH